MKRITLALSLVFLVGNTFAQTPSSAIQAELQQEQLFRTQVQNTTTIDDLLARIAAQGNQAGVDTSEFTAVERQMIHAYYNSQNRNSLANIIPTAGATETFAVATGDFFYDPTDGVNGGPGGVCTGTSSGDPGDYPNCGCTTVTTLTGTGLEVEFLSFNIFGTFDILNIYDGPDTSSPQIYDSNLNANTDTLAGMIAANGSAVFTSTSGALTFEFSATAVVNSCGWEVEVLNSGGGGGMDEVFAFDAGFCSDDMGTFALGGPYTINAVNTSTSQLFAGDYDGSGNLYALDNATLSLISIDPVTGVETTVGPLTNIQANHGVRGLAWNYSNSTMYALTGFGDDHTIYTVDLATGTLTVVGTAVLPGALGIWLAIDNDGNGYMAELGADVLYAVDVSTAVATLIGPLGISINFAQDADFDPVTNTLYMGAYIGGGANEWASVDISTGAATALGPVNANCAELGIVAIAGTPPPNNDVCIGATPVTCGEIVVGTTADNTDTGGFNASPDEWYSFTGTVVNEIVTLSLCSGTSYDSILTVYDACGGAVVVNNDDACGLQSEVSFISDGVSTYYIAVEGFGTGSGAFNMTVSCNPVAANDECANAETISCGQTILGSTNFATLDAAAPVCNTSITAPGVWYTFTDTSGLLTDYVVSLCDGGTAYDSKLTVYSGDCGTLTCIGDNDDPCGLQSEVAFQGDGSTTYYILVHGFGGAQGDFSLNLNCTPVPPPNDMIANSIDVDEIGFPYTDPSVAMPAATTEAGNPTGCNIDGANGVWYNFVSQGNGGASCTILNPGGASSVTFYTAPDESSTEAELTLVPQGTNQCGPGVNASINTVAGQAYYVFVVNTGAASDILIQGYLLGVDENGIEGFSFYPNPANEILTISALDTIEHVAVYNMLGQTVLNQKINATSSQLDVSGFATGTYILKATVNGQIGTYQIIKE
ncbi:T9SS type A sorting domain-containing protein [Altibacter lentus]|uniref:T9SS type A sorting domain-containing protein n=1 Tax=Altibacter lentus TaxID=1223410 RepID=UPI0005594283|nr:T9SS type A sorting domain-containing protein [Altibacter lentus]